MADLQVPAVEMLNRSPVATCDRFEADNRGGARIAVDHLIACGHRRIGFIGGLPNSTGVSRADGFRDGLAAAKIEPVQALETCGDYTRSGGQKACRAMLASGNAFTAIFCASDIMAYGAMDELAAHDLRVPQDVAIIGFDDMEMSSLPGVGLSSISFGPVTLARKAIDRLIQRIGADDLSGPVISELEPCRLIVRASTAGFPSPGTGR